ncbi:MAG TPA: ABC transporter ATP-binding protein [bacterium]|nr:ABC transporter ATP-binding protein [bacterium]
MQPLIQAKNLRKSYWIDAIETPVLKGVDLSIGPASLTAIVGASGTGKSTLLHVLSALDRPDSGEVLFEGENLYARDDERLSEFRNKTVGFVFQFHHLLPEFTALENVMMPLLVRGVSRTEASGKALVCLDRLGLGARAEHRPAELSGGEQQRVAVARAMVGEPRVLFADEPTGNLDEENGRKLVDLLLDLHRERGTALVLVTHNAAVAGRFPEKIRIEGGRVGGAA